MKDLPAPLRAALALVVLAAVTLSAGLGWADSAPAFDEEHYLVDDRGRPIRVVFPLHDRITFDFYGAGRSGGDDARQPEIVRGGRLTVRHSFEAPYPEEEVWWRFRHRWLALGALREGDELRLDMTLLSANYMRHAANNYIVIPAADHARIPAPFDIAFEYEVFGITYDDRIGELTSARVAEFAVLLDFLRDSAYRHRLALGPVMAYEIERVNGPDEEEEFRVHRFIPASGGRLIYQWEDASGRMAVEGRLQCAAAALLIDREMSWRPLCDGEIKAERTVLAINDRPLNLFVEGALRDSPDRPEFGSSLKWSATLGLRLSLWRGGR